MVKRSYNRKMDQEPSIPVESALSISQHTHVFHALFFCRSELVCTAKIFLIGFHKSGSTEITDWFFRHPDVLQTGSDLFLMPDNGKQHDGEAADSHSWNYQGTANCLKGIIASTRPKLAHYYIIILLPSLCRSIGIPSYCVHALLHNAITPFAVPIDRYTLVRYTLITT